MKTTTLIFAAFFTTLVCVAQEKKEKGLKENEIPAAVRGAFAKRFPKATDVKWFMESATDFEAEFKMDKTEMSANFDKIGNWVVTETEIKNSELPKAVQASLAREFAGYKIEEAEKVEKPDQAMYYEVALAKGKAKLGIEIGADGKVMKKEEKKEKEDKD